MAPSPPFDVAHVESDSECDVTAMCDVFMMSEYVCHVPSLMAHKHLALMFTCNALATATSRRKAFCSSATTQQKKAEHGSAVFHTASFGYPEAATNFFMAQDSVCENAPMMHLKIFKYGWFQTPRTVIDSRRYCIFWTINLNFSYPFSLNLVHP